MKGASDLCSLYSLLSRVNFRRWPSSPASLRSPASAPGCKACSASTGKKGTTPTSCRSKNGRKWNWPQTQLREPPPPRPSANWSAPANGCIPSDCPEFWNPHWCASAPGTSTGRRDEATPSIPSRTFTCRTALPCGESIGSPTPAPGAWPTPAASWWTIVISWTTRQRTVFVTCRIRSSRLQSRFWDSCRSFRRTANCDRDEDTIVHAV